MKYTLMNAPMSLATQQGIKTQTRRIIKGDPRVDDVGHWLCSGANWGVGSDGKPYMKEFIKWRSPYKIGEVLWIREPATVVGTYGDNGIDSFKAQYLSDGKVSDFIDAERFLKGNEYPEWITYCEGIPNGCIREMARTFIRITNIRVERLDEIEYDDVLAEGFPLDSYEMKQTDKLYSADMHGEVDFEEDRAFEWFTSLWESINGKNSFDNRWVWVIEYELISKKEAL